MRINTNIASLNAQRTLAASNSAVGKQIAKLSSGFRINKAADDAAGLGIANQLRADIRSLKQASRNAEQATSMLQIAEGAAQTIGSIVDRMKELATQAASDNVSDGGRGSIKTEWVQLQQEITRIVDTTKFQKSHLLKSEGASPTATPDALTAPGVIGSAAATDTAATGEYEMEWINATTFRLSQVNGSLSEVGTLAGGDVQFANLGVTVTLGLADVSSDPGAARLTVARTVTSGGPRDFLVSSSGSYAGDDLVSLSALDLTTASLGIDTTGIPLTGNGTAAQWRTALDRIDTGIGRINEQVSTIGAAQNRIEFATQNVKATIENMTAAESTIRDADMASEMAEFTRNQILQQAGTAMLAQANSAPQMVLRLLQ